MTKQLWALLGFTVLYLTGALAATLLMGNSEFLFYLAAAPFILGGLAVLHKQVNLPVPLLWCLSVLGVLHVLGGLVPVPEHVPTEGKKLLYNVWIFPEGLKFDQAVHAFGNGLATWLCWDLLKHSISQAIGREVCDIPPKAVYLWVCYLAGIGIGAINEVGEFATTYVVKDHNVGDYKNTGWDLVANTFGGAVAVFFIWWNGRNSRMVTTRKPAAKNGRKLRQSRYAHSN